MATGSVFSEITEKERKKLLEILQQDPDSLLDTLTSRRLISEEEYETLEDITDALKKSQKLLILVQKKGEHNTESPPSVGINENSDGFLPGGKQPENPEITEPFKEKEHVDLETSQSFRDNKTGYRETAWSSRENEKEYNTPKVALPHSVENVEYEVPATIECLQDGQRYEEPDDSLYLGEEGYLESVGYPVDAEITVEEEDYADPDYIVYDGEEHCAYSETTEFSDKEQSHEDSETGMSLEEEEEKNMEGRRMMCVQLGNNLF